LKDKENIEPQTRRALRVFCFFRIGVTDQEKETPDFILARIALFLFLPLNPGSRITKALNPQEGNISR